MDNIQLLEKLLEEIRILVDVVYIPEISDPCDFSLLVAFIGTAQNTLELMK